MVCFQREWRVWGTRHGAFAAAVCVKFLSRPEEHKSCPNTSSQPAGLGRFTPSSSFHHSLCLPLSALVRHALSRRQKLAPADTLSSRSILCGSIMQCAPKWAEGRAHTTQDSRQGPCRAQRHASQSSTPSGTVELNSFVSSFSPVYPMHRDKL